MKHLGLDCNPGEQCTNTVIDHINKKCFIIQNNWSEKGQENIIKIFEGNLPSNRQRVEDFKLMSPLNCYLTSIFKEKGFFVSCLMINSAFKNVIRDIDFIHCFYKGDQGE